MIIFVTDQPSDLVVITVNGAHVAVWNGITCTGTTINYKVVITQVNDSVSTQVILTSITEMTLPALQPNTEYSVSVTAVASTCSSASAVTTFMSEFEGSQQHANLLVVTIHHVTIYHFWS